MQKEKNYKKIKQFLKTSLVLICVVLFVLNVGIFVYKNICDYLAPSKLNQKQNVASEIIGYNFENAEYVKSKGKYRISNDDYLAYKEFSITSLKGLLIFANIVSEDNCDSSRYYDSFKDKKVFLEKSIDCEGKEISIGDRRDNNSSNNCIFKGDFDGRGHTISNFTFGLGVYHLSKGLKNFYCGFFTYFMGTLQNLNLDDFRSSSQWTSATYGGLIGYADNATIINCRVSNFSLPRHGGGMIGCVTGEYSYKEGTTISEDDMVKIERCEVSNCELISGGGLIGECVVLSDLAKGFMTIKQCAVKNVKFPSASSSAGLLGGFKSYAAIFKGIFNIFCSDIYISASSLSAGIIYCPTPVGVFAENPARYLNFKDVIVNCDNIRYGFTCGFTTSGLVGSCDSMVSKLENCVTSKNAKQGFDYSNIGGIVEDTIWYYGGDEFNNGWMYLREFIEWEILTFIEKSNVSYIIPSEIYIAKESADILTGKEGKTVVVCAVPIEAVVRQGMQTAFWEYYKVHPDYDNPVYFVSGGLLGEYKISFSYRIKDNSDITSECWVDGIKVDDDYYLVDDYELYPSRKEENERFFVVDCDDIVEVNTVFFAGIQISNLKIGGDSTVVPIFKSITYDFIVKDVDINGKEVKRNVVIKFTCSNSVALYSGTFSNGTFLHQSLYDFNIYRDHCNAIQEDTSIHIGTIKRTYSVTIK